MRAIATSSSIGVRRGSAVAAAPSLLSGKSLGIFPLFLSSSSFSSSSFSSASIRRKILCSSFRGLPHGSAGAGVVPPTSKFSLCIQNRKISVTGFAAAIEQLQAQQRAVQTASPLDSNAGGAAAAGAAGLAGGAELADRQSKINKIQQYGKQLFDTDVIEPPAPAAAGSGEDGSNGGGGWTPPVASIIAQAAVQWRISPLRGQPYAEVLNWSMSRAAEAVMDTRSLARIIHSALVLRAPQLYPLLMTYIPLLVQTCSTPTSPNYQQLRSDPATLAALINAYGRAGVNHEILYEKLCGLGEEVLQDPSLSIAHVANATQALAKVPYPHRGILSTLRNQAVRQKQSATPLMSITLIHAFAELSFKDEELFSVYEQHLLNFVGELTPALLAALLHSLVLAERTGTSSSSSSSSCSSASVLLQRIGEQITRTAARFDAYPIAKVMTAYFAAGTFSEEALGALAERACAVVSDFRSEEVARVLEALSALDLFDGELFPLLASRLATLVKQAAPMTIEDAACVLASFAAVQEPNDELHHWCGKVFAEYADASMLSAEAYINVIWGCLSLNIRNEAQKKFVEAVKAKPQLLQPLETEEKKWHKPKKAILDERRAKIIKAYGITV